MTLLQQHILEVLNCLEQEIAKPCVVDHTGIVTNHMRAAWGARDAINQLFEHWGSRLSRANLDVAALTSASE